MTAHPHRIVVGDDGEVFALGEIVPPPRAWEIEDRKGAFAIRAIVLGCLASVWLFAVAAVLFLILAPRPPLRAPVASTVAHPAADPLPLTDAIEAASVGNRRH